MRIVRFFSVLLLTVALGFTVQQDDDAALLRRATGYENVEGKEVPPDVRAAVFWLKNRRPESWKDRREVAVSDPVTVTFKPEEKDL